MRQLINPFSYLLSSLVTSKNNFLTILKEDPDDLAEDIIKLLACGTVNYLAVNLGTLTFYQIVILNLIAYIPINIVADYIGDLIDAESEMTTKENGEGSEIPFLSTLASDMAEDSCKLFFITAYYLAGTGLSIAEKKLPYPVNIIAKIASYFYATTDLLSSYHQWNQFADGVGNWAEDGVDSLLGNTTSDATTLQEL